MRKLIPILFSLICAQAFAQWKDIPLSDFSNLILELESKVPANTSYSYKAKYHFYEQLDSKEAKLSMDYVLIYKAKTGQLYLNQFGRETYQDNAVQIICDTAAHMLVVNKPTPELIQRKTLDDFKLLLQSKCKAMKIEKEDETGYYLQFAEGATYKGAELWVSKKGVLSRYTLYTGKQVLDDSGQEDKMVQPRMEIIFSDYLYGSKVDSQNSKTSKDYFLNLEKMEVKPEYKDFELVDLRNND